MWVQSSAPGGKRMSKADFTSIYTAPDPRSYYLTLGELDYQVPDHGGRVFSQLASHLRDERGLPAVRLADLCCSYGVNAAVVKCGRTFGEVVEHYADEAVLALDIEDLIELDREWYGASEGDVKTNVVGLDVSQPAIDYATAVGLLDSGAAEDLERADPSPSLEHELAAVDLVTITGGIGYIGEATVGRVLEAAPERAWLAALCLRWIDFEPIAKEAERHGLVTERWEAETFPQRRFADDVEREHALAELGRLDVDAGGREDLGYHHTALYIARPVDDAARMPLAEMLGAPA